MSLLIRNAVILPCTEGHPILSDHAILCRNGHVEKIAPTKDIPPEADKVIDAGGRMLLPGFIDAQTHFYASFTQAIPREIKDPTSALSLEDCRYSALAYLIQALKNGVTTLFATHKSPAAEIGSLMKIGEAATATGQRVCLSYEMTDEHGENLAPIFEEIEAYLKDCKKGDTERLTGLIGLKKPAYCTPETVDKVLSLAEKYDAGIHLQVACTPRNQKTHTRTHKVRIIEQLEKLNLLSSKTFCSGIIALSAPEIDILAKTDTTLAYTPLSDHYHAVGKTDMPALLRHRIATAIGSGALSYNLRAVQRTALLSLMNMRNQTALADEDQKRLMNDTGIVARRTFGEKTGLGTLTEGGVADLVLLDQIPPTPMTDETRLSHFLSSIADASVHTTVARGAVLMEDHKLTHVLDEERIFARARELAAAFYKRL